jgi:uncharacterized protein YaiE (UPF0345 family)
MLTFNFFSQVFTYSCPGSMTTLLYLGGRSSAGNLYSYSSFLMLIRESFNEQFSGNYCTIEWSSSSKGRKSSGVLLSSKKYSFLKKSAKSFSVCSFTLLTLTMQLSDSWVFWLVKEQEAWICFGQLELSFVQLFERN